MQKIHPRRVGTIIGLLFALYHAMWATLVYLGFAKSFLDWVLKMHFLHFEYNVEPFVFSHAAILVILTGVVGYVAGFILGMLWNFLYKNINT